MIKVRLNFKSGRCQMLYIPLEVIELFPGQLELVGPGEEELESVTFFGLEE